MGALRKGLRNLVAAVPPLETALQSYVNRRRVARARSFMRANYLYPAAREAILDDYAYALKAANRGVLQVLNIEEAVRHVASRGIPGAFVECGTFTGGSSAYALRSIMRNEPGKERRPYWGFDSFEGMPKPTKQDGTYALRWMYGRSDVDPSQLSGDLSGCDLNRANYEECLRYLRGTSYPSEHIHLVKGWFQDTLPASKAAIGPIAILRIDGDFYASTKVALERLFANVAPGGLAVIDDYGVFEGCRMATDEYLASAGLKPYLQYVDHSIRMFMRPF